MATEFNAAGEFKPEQCSEIAALDPYNPFYTPEYAKAREATGSEAWLLWLTEKKQVTSGCLAFMRSGRLNRSLEIPSLPAAGIAEEFWKGLLELCRKDRVSELVAQSFASSSAAIPAIPGTVNRRVREEYILDIGEPKGWAEISSNHKRNIQKAKKAGILIEQDVSGAACEQHARLQDASMERRMGRGEQVQADAQVQVFKALVDHRAGELFRATQDGKVLSSILILRAKRGAYYHSAGTNAEGMALGASHLLIFQVAERLRAEGLARFNLGSAGGDNPGLERFKKGFGTRTVGLEAAEFYFGNRWQKSLGAMGNLVRRLIKGKQASGGNRTEPEKGPSSPP